jgi:hypothetical protein
MLMALSLVFASCKEPVIFSYTVTFDVNGGDGTAPSARTVNYGSVITLPGRGALSKSGYIFGGWNTTASGDGTNYDVDFPYTVTGNATLFARWRAAETYTVTFNINGGSGKAPAAQTASLGSTITLPGGDGLLKTDYVFGGWNTTANGTGTNYSAGYSYTVTGNIMLYARWFSSALTSIEEASAYIAAASGGASSNPIPLKMRVPLGNMTESDSNWQRLLGAIGTAEKYVTLDLSACAMSGDVFNIGDINAGKNWILSLVLPDVAKSILTGSSDSPVFTELAAVTGKNITNISGNAFNGYSKLAVVSFPAATGIGTDAFSGCTSLIDVSFPAATDIGGYAFYYCTGLTSVSFPAAINIENNAFEGCSSLINITDVSFPAVTYIGSNAFRDCNKLISTVFPSAINIDSYAFNGCSSLVNVSFPSATVIGHNAFNGCSNLNSVSFPAVIRIENNAFQGCFNLNIVTLGTITSSDFSASSFPGNLREVYFAENGGAGMYTTANPGNDAVWTKQ